MYCLIKVIIDGVSNGLVTNDHGRRYLSKVGGMRIEDGCTGKTTKRIPCSRVMSYFNIVNADKYIFYKQIIDYTQTHYNNIKKISNKDQSRSTNLWTI